MCLLGNPVGHSLSPGLHNELCRLTDYDGVYTAFSPEREDLGEAILGLKALGAKGFNVTYPYKEAVMPFLDEIHEDAKLLKAVNTVVIDNNKLAGYNTDVFGVEQLMIRNKVTVKSAVACIFGTGGASRASALALQKMGVSRIDFYSRSIKKNTVIQKISEKVEVHSWTYESFEDNKKCYDILINGTPLGMGVTKDEQVIDPVNLKERATIIDLIYSPWETKLLTSARCSGYNIINGYDMLYYQGLKAFSLWTDEYIDYYSEIKSLLIK